MTTPYPAKRRSALAASLWLLVGAQPAAAALDLTAWQAEGYELVPLWQVEPGGTAVSVLGNQNSSFLAGGVESQQRAISLTISVESGLDDDFFGFALGFDPGDTANPAADFIYLDWKKTTTFSAVGMALSRVVGVPTNLDELGLHMGDHVTELARATGLGDVGWTEGTDYHFEIVFTEQNVEVRVNGALELDVDGSFSPGGFALYNRSQPDARYRDVVIEELPVPSPSPVPALPPGLLAALAALLAVALWRAHAAPGRREGARSK